MIHDAQSCGMANSFHSTDPSFRDAAAHAAGRKALES
jgi:hypothetical protein